MPELIELADAFLRRFRGLDRAHGEYVTDGTVSAKGKANGRANTILTGPNLDLWQKHLAGAKRLGIIPITDEATCYFGAIDIDEYQGFDLNEVEARVTKLGLPLTLCRSKSGGAHLYLFMSEAADAALVRDRLAAWATLLGHPGVEVFPKQSKLASDKDVGNWINMPYFDHELTMSYAIENGAAVDAPRFLKLAASRAISEEQLRDLDVRLPTLPKGAPPCLQAMAASGVPEGMRNNALFAFAVLSRLQHEEDPNPEAWHGTAHRYNEELMDPPLRPREVEAVIKSVSGKSYFYTCESEPLASFCNKRACRKAAYGIGGGDGPEDPGVMVDGVTKILTDPPTWIFRIAGVNVELDTDDFLQQSRFKRKCAEKLNRIPQTLKQNKWERFVNKLLQQAREEEAPEDASAFGQFLTHLYDFCNRQSRGTTRESLATNGLYHDEDAGRIYFKSVALKKYLEQQKFRDYNDKQLWNALRKVEGVKHGNDNIKGRFINHWSIPEANLTKEDYTVPRMPEEEF